MMHRTSHKSEQIRGVQGGTQWENQPYIYIYNIYLLTYLLTKEGSYVGNSGYTVTRYDAPCYGVVSQFHPQSFSKTPSI